MRPLPWLLSLVFAGCAEDPEVRIVDGELPFVDHTVDIPEPPSPGTVLRTPIIEIPPFTEAQVCTFGTWEGPTMGLVWAFEHQDRQITHHMALLDVFDDKYADGEAVDCIGNDAGQMATYGPLIDGAGPELEDDFQPPGPQWDVQYWDEEVAEVSMVVLPEGVAFPMRTGQRWAIDYHSLNFYDKPMRTNAGYEVGLVPEDEVEHWAGAGMFDTAPFSLPPGDSHIVVDCAFENDVTILNVAGHMHDYGTSFVTELVRTDGTREVVYEVSEWTPELKTGSRSIYFPPGELEVKAGDRFVTTCRWHNFHDEWLPYPAEMCTTNFVGYPLEEGMLCLTGEPPIRD